MASCPWLPPTNSRADLVIYQIGDSLALVLPEGEAKMLPGRSISYRIPGTGKLTLATYFETPEGAGWGGIGAVNEDRLNW